MKRVFILSIEDGTKVVGLQIGVAVQRESDGKQGVTFFGLPDSDIIRENDEWLFKVNGKAERLNNSENPTKADVLDKIRAEIEHVIDYTYDSTDYDKSLYNGAYKDGLYEALDIIDKYKVESEDI